MFELAEINGRLHYRQWQVRVDAGGAITPLPMPITWTEWMPVRVMSAAKAELERFNEGVSKEPEGDTAEQLAQDAEDAEGMEQAHEENKIVHHDQP